MPIDIRQKIRQVGVLGAGTMGNGIAQAFAGAQTRHSEPHLTRPVASKRRLGGERMSKSDGGPVSERPGASFVQGTVGFGSSHRPADVDANQQPPDDLRLRPSMGARP